MHIQISFAGTLIHTSMPSDGMGCLKRLLSNVVIYCLLLYNTDCLLLYNPEMFRQL